MSRYDNYSGQYNLQTVVQKGRYSGYKDKWPSEDYNNLVIDVMIRYQLEKLGYQDVGRVIPSDYIFFMGDKKCTNYFINFPHKGNLKTAKNNAWNWGLEDPYHN